MEPDNPLRGLATGDAEAVCSQLDHLDDRAIVGHVTDVLGEPPVEPADSFVLHAPLELMARAELLLGVEAAARGAARRRIVEIAAEWLTRAPHVALPSTEPSASLPDAIAAGDLDEADRAVVALAASRTVDEFVAGAAGALASHLGGAGHLSIFLDQVARAHRPTRAALTASRALVRDLARHPDWTLRWVDDAPLGRVRPGIGFSEVLANPPSAGDPGTNFIYPTMHLVDSTGMAAELLTVPAHTLPVDEARRQLLRIAAMSMLQDDAASAPYGWSHCLTMPQATLAVASRTADPQRCVAIAATYVLGFRSTLSTTTIDLDWEPARPRTEGAILDSDVDVAVERAWHAEDPDGIERELTTNAATHHDAHLAKYTLACLHAGADDPESAPLYRAAAARLAVWWRDHDETQRLAGAHDREAP